MKCCTVNIQLTCELLYNKHITNLRIAVGGGAPEISSLKQKKTDDVQTPSVQYCYKERTF